MTGYKLVPVEPTAEMMEAGGIEMGARDEDARAVWKAMIAAAPAVQGEAGVKWAPEEVANGNKGIRWVSDEGVHGRPTDHDCRVYLESNPNARGCHCPECTMLYTAPQPAAHQPCPEGVREGAPYDDPAFEAVCREYGIWGTPASAQCAVFWEAGKRVAEQKPAPDVAGLVEAASAALDEIEAIMREAYSSAEPVCCGRGGAGGCCGSPEPEWSEIDQNTIGRLWPHQRALTSALAAHRKQGGEV